MKCLQRCFSPTACGSFGYCRERNYDGMPMTEANMARRRKEQEISEKVCGMKITVETIRNKVMVFHFAAHDAIDKMVAALKENIPDWKKIIIEINQK